MSFFNSGQACIAAKRMIVPEDLYEPFVERLVTEVKALRVGDPLDPATFTGTLQDRAGEPLVGRAVASYLQEGGRRWRIGPETLTDEGGSFALEVPVRRNTKVIAVYHGDALTWGAQSSIVRARVAPLVTIEARDAEVGAGGMSHYPSGTTGVTLAGMVDPAHIHRTVDVKVSRWEGGAYSPVATATVDLDDDSAYEYLFPVTEDGGTYQAIAIFRGDADHAGARSETVSFVVAP